MGILEVGVHGDSIGSTLVHLDSPAATHSSVSLVSSEVAVSSLGVGAPDAHSCAGSG
jgi:hypothetical protein